MNKQDLKCCPFCGCEVMHLGSNNGWRMGYYISCQRCGTKSGLYLKKDNAIKSWNKRYERD